MTPSGIFPVTFWLVANCLNQMHHHLHPQTAKCFCKLLGTLPGDLKITRQTAKFFTVNRQTFNCEGWNFNSGNYLFTTDTK